MGKGTGDGKLRTEDLAPRMAWVDAHQLISALRLSLDLVGNEAMVSLISRSAVAVSGFILNVWVGHPSLSG